MGEVGEFLSDALHWGGGGATSAACDGSDTPVRLLTDSFRTGGGGGLSGLVWRGEEWM